MKILDSAAGPLEASILVEGLRARPGWFVGLSLICYVIVWSITLQIVESAPAPELAVALALGREWQSGYAGAAPLPLWIAESVFRFTHSFFLLRLLAVVCVALAGWLVFLFARRIIGARHAAIASLLMIGVYPVAWPAETWSAQVLQMPLIAAAIYLWWRGVGERNPYCLAALGIALAATLYTGPQGIVLFVVFVLAKLVSPRARAAFTRFEMQIGGGFFAFFFILLSLPRLFWLTRNGWRNLLPGIESGIPESDLLHVKELLLPLAAGHAGLLALVCLAAVYAVRAKQNAPVFVREPESMLARRSTFALALLPLPLALLWLWWRNTQTVPAAASSLLLLSGVAVIMFAGQRVRIRRQQAIAGVMAGFLFFPAAVQIAATYTSSWLWQDKRSVNWPAEPAARTFTEIFRTRTGEPLAYIIGERIPASQIAALSRERPRVFIDADISQNPWVDIEEFKRRGGVVFWEVRGVDVDPPAWLRAWLPPFIPEAPLRLPWTRGGGDPVRLGWAIVLPAAKMPKPVEQLKTEEQPKTEPQPQGPASAPQ